jgi:hypothetical protein
VRAGDTTADQGLTASNDGDPNTILTGVTYGALTGTNTDALTTSAAPTDEALAKDAGGTSETVTRTYSAAPLGKDDTGGISVDAIQGVTATNGTIDDVERSITADVKGPILGVAKQGDNPDTAQSSDWADYGSTINLGDYSIGDPDLLEALVLANIFGAADADFTMLTFYNVGLVSGAGGTFSIVSGAPPADTKLQAQNIQADPLMIRFAGADDLPYWTATLSFSTDQNSTFGVQNPTDLTFTLRVDNAAFAPVPGVLALLVFGLVPLAASRRRLSVPA